MMDESDTMCGIVENFKNIIDSNPDTPESVAAIKTLLAFIEKNEAHTMQGLTEDLNKAISILKTTDSGKIPAIASGCELFLRFITFANLEYPDLQECKKIMIQRGGLFLDKISKSRDKIAQLANQFITNGAVILLHSYSRVVLEILKVAKNKNKQFKCFVTNAQPNDTGKKMCKSLQELDISSTLILDAAIGYIMEKVTMVLVGAEQVVESGGIINRIGTFTIGISAKELNKPFYVAVESVKFGRYYPLNQQDIPKEFKYPAKVIMDKGDLNEEHPLVDYTPPSYITLLFTDLGILTPSAVSDELIKIYV